MAVVAVGLALFSAGCAGPGTSDNVEIVRGDSSRFSVAEIEAAEAAVMERFKSFKGCNLLRLRYDEVFSDNGTEVYMKYGGGLEGEVAIDNVIVLESEFHVGKFGGDGSLNRDSDYTGWSWTLTRDSPSSPWQVTDYGQG
ncbi:MAG: hypothetical protein LBO75_03225 [Bifidobacteriaceae bacterium]|nr:hypothetical protein [Bifidobacteriaceae bacterium]